ncbi:MAG TPA: efflux RND transporter periplasmic adaptor subunit [Planctomycetota bacterium]|nr:efflux RND transporter periplasmic adaptor subunit [Planctomycetota bacterium]
MKKIVLIVAVLLALGGGVFWYLHRQSGQLQYRTVKATRGTLRVSVTATGQINPFVQVQVGTQVTGVIQRLFVDYNCVVKTGQQIAQIDPTSFQSIVDQNRANLLAAKANVLKIKASLVQAEKDLGRDKELAKRDLIAPTDLDAAVANYDSLVAQLAAADAGVEQAKATLANSEVNLQYTKITSPIDGVIIQRSVDVGQTLAASLSAPTMYVIADDMKKIQILASVAEADIGRISEGQEVSFTVDAYRDTQFKGAVSQIRLFPTTVQNVVTYTVMIDADNPGGKLLPGMTANATFEVAEYKDVLRIPNACLRFVAPWDTPGEGSGRGGEAHGPRKADSDEPKTAGSGDGAVAHGGNSKHPESPHPADPAKATPASTPTSTAPPPPAAPQSPYEYKAPGAPEYKFGGAAGEGGRPPRKHRVRIWVVGPQGPLAVMVTPGATDGTSTEVLAGDLKEGQEVITGIVQDGADSAAMSNPFAPRMGGQPPRR